VFNVDFNEKKLLQHNYITSVSLIKRDLLDRIGGFVIDRQYERLLDYCLWLTFLRYGYHGIKGDIGFVTGLNKNNVSGRGQEDYIEKMKRVKQDFILPYF
jgi:hypothetical protein